jgi:hypothetical protein
MGIFDFFQHKNETSLTGNEPKIEFGFRGEDITYFLQGKEAYISFTWCNGDRVYTDSITEWNDGSSLTNEEKERVFNDVLQFLKRGNRKLIVVINKDDPSRNIWERICSINQSIVSEIEYTSDEENYQFQQNMHLDTLRSGGRIIFGETEVRNEKELDEALQKYRTKREGR